MQLIQGLANELQYAITDPTLWLSIVLALVIGALILAFGASLARFIGLLRPGAPAGEIIGVGLSVGLLVAAAWWAAIWSGGRSAFTPVAIGFALAIGLAIARSLRGSATAETAVSTSLEPSTGPAPTSRRGFVMAMLAAGAFVALAALLFAITLVPIARDGLQPVEFNDVAFYGVLGRDLASTGTEANYAPSGFESIAGAPVQLWYHWGELWLASALIKLLGVSAVAARYFVVLPLILLAAATLTGTVVRRITGATSTRVFLFGFLSCLFLAPFGLIPGPFFASWASGFIFGVTIYGLSAVAILLSLYGVAALRDRSVPWPLAVFVGSIVASIIPTHIAVGLLVAVGLGTVAVARGVVWIARPERRSIPTPSWLRVAAAAGIAAVATVVWGVLTGHGLGAGGGPPPLVSPFNATWGASVALTAIGAGAMLAIVFAWLLVPEKPTAESDMYLGTCALLVAGAIGWGLRAGDFTMFYLFFAGIAVIATPVAVVAIRRVWEYLSATGRSTLALLLVVLVALQLEVGVTNGVGRLRFFSAGDGRVPDAVSAAIRALPDGAKLAYSCQPLDESGFGVPWLLSIDLHTGRRIIPMCFEAETLSSFIGAPADEHVPNLFFAFAPQRELYPTFDSAPTPAAVSDFMKQHGIGYIYVDGSHPNRLVPDAIPIAADGDVQVLRLP